MNHSENTMKLVSTLLLTLSSFTFLIGCGEETVSSSSVNNTKGSDILSHQMKALEKAKNLEAELNKSVKDRLKSIDAQK